LYRFHFKFKKTDKQGKYSFISLNGVWLSLIYYGLGPIICSISLKWLHLLIII
jgi:hypothetical protein